MFAMTKKDLDKLENRYNIYVLSIQDKFYKK